MLRDAFGLGFDGWMADVAERRQVIQRVRGDLVVAKQARRHDVVDVQFGRSRTFAFLARVAVARERFTSAYLPKFTAFDRSASAVDVAAVCARIRSDVFIPTFGRAETLNRAARNDDDISATSTDDRLAWFAEPRFRAFRVSGYFCAVFGRPLYAPACSFIWIASIAVFRTIAPRAAPCQRSVNVDFCAATRARQILAALSLRKLLVASSDAFCTIVTKARTVLTRSADAGRTVAISRPAEETRRHLIGGFVSAFAVAKNPAFYPATLSRKRPSAGFAFNYRHGTVDFTVRKRSSYGS